MKTILTTIFVLLSFFSFSQIKETIVQMKTWTTPFIENYNANQLIRVKDDSVLYSLRYSETSGKTMLYLKNNNRLKTIGSSSYWLANGTNIYYNAGKVGIGSTATPDSTFQVTGGAKFTRDVVVNGVRVGKGKGSVNTNTVVGSNGLNANTTGQGNSAVGYGILYKNTTGSYNTAIGESAMTENTTGWYNTALGYYTLGSNVSGRNNVAVGQNSLNRTTSNANVGIGASTLQANITGYSNTAVGVSALYSNTTASNLVAVGDSALYKNTGTGNTAVGSKALYANVSGKFNTAVGFNSLKNNINEYNTGVGYSSLISNTNGYNNSVAGYNAMGNNTDGYSNTSMGYYSLSNNTTGYENIAIGEFAGTNYTGNAANLYSNKSIFIGNYTKAKQASQTNEIVVGYNTTGHGSNTTTIGNTSTTDTYLYGNLSVSGSVLRVETTKTPSSATDTGNAGDICWDANYVYICVATNTWKRAELSTWP